MCFLSFSYHMGPLFFLSISHCFLIFRGNKNVELIVEQRDDTDVHECPFLYFYNTSPSLSTTTLTSHMPLRRRLEDKKEKWTLVSISFYTIYPLGQIDANTFGCIVLLFSLNLSHTSSLSFSPLLLSVSFMCANTCFRYAKV